MEFKDITSLRAAGLGVFPCHPDKSPAVPKGASWQDVATMDPNTLHWPSKVIGLPVPPGVVVIDLDTYKGVTRTTVERLIGAPLDWDEALLQTTQNGGEHYAFRTGDWEVRQGSDIEGLTGFDTRTAGRGYIASGQGYTVRHMFGLYCLANVGGLPRLPDETRTVLERVERQRAEPVELPRGDKDIETVKEALSFLNPECGRSEWLRVGLALRHQFHDDPDAGLVIFDQWSRGSLTGGEVPTNYDPDSMDHQWNSFKVEGGVTIASMFYAAIAHGWKPPAGVDTSQAFGQTADQGLYDALVDNITSNGGNPKKTDELVKAVKALRCSEIQRGMLLATLHRELKDAGLLTKEVKEALETRHATRGLGEYGKNHTENATIFIDNHYSDQTLVRCKQVWYSFDGKSWVKREDEEIKHEVALAMSSGMPQHSLVTGTYSMLETLATVSAKQINDVPRELILMQNGVLNLNTGALLSHDVRLFTTNILPYNYNINAECPTWERFLWEVFEGDFERIALLQEWSGYMMSNSYEHHKIMLLLGSFRCGKGTVGRVLKSLVGEANFSGGTMTSFVKDPYIDAIAEKTVVFIGDAAKNIPRYQVDSVTERLKGISGGDDQAFDRKHKKMVTQRIAARITVAANHVPGMFDDSGALASRLLVLPFNVTFLGREDPYLSEKLEAEIEGIAMWSLVGLARLRERGQFTLPAASAAEIQYIKDAYSPLRMFVEACCVIGGEGSASSTEVYDAYRAWAIQAQEDHILARRTFTNNFRDLTRGSGCKYGVYRSHRWPKPMRGFKGLRLRPTEFALKAVK